MSRPVTQTADGQGEGHREACCAAQIHDELLLEVDEKVLPEVCVLVRECMEGAASLSVPMRVKLSVGPSWGQLEPYR